MSEVKKMNIDRVMQSMHRKNNETPKVLNAIRNRAYNLYNIDHKSEEEVISAVFNFSKIAIQEGKVTKEEVEKEIAKVLSIDVKNNNKTR